MKHWLPALVIGCVLAGPAFTVADEAEEYDSIRKLITDKKFDEAAGALKKALEEYPDSSRLTNLYLSMYSGAMREGQMPLAQQALAEMLERQMDDLSDPVKARRLSSYISMYMSLSARTNKEAEGKAMLERALKELSKAGDDPAILNALLTVQIRKASMLRADGDAAAALAMVKDARKRIEGIYNANKDDIELSLLRATAMQRLLSFLPAGDAEARTKLENEHLTFLETLVADHPEQANVVTALISARISTISSKSRSEPEQAQQQLQDLKKYLDSLDTENQAISRAVSNYSRSIASIERRIEMAMKHLKLVGESAYPIDPAVETWVNGKAITDSELKGKVVLLDFWAVWCGPCIATFPHLREWHEEYADDGLVIIGVTRYYNYEWNEDANRASRSKEEVAPADENKMLERFAAHHELHHRFLVTNDGSELNQQYGVTGIPQAVLIGRDGKVRMIRVGSGAQNAEDLGQMLKKLIEESSVATGE